MIVFTFHRYAAIAILFAAAFSSADTILAQERTVAGISDQIDNIAAEAIATNSLPGMIAAICDENGLLGVGVAGVRKIGNDTEITRSDLVHLGSCTKAMTSTMLATLVADGHLRWESTLIEVFPELADSLHPDYHAVTLWQLVSHRSGMPENATNWWTFADKDIVVRRLEIMKVNLATAPTNARGTYQYSNLGYMVAGCMAERVTGKPWETLMRERLFMPLGMISAGFGAPGTPEEIDQPWGHRQVDGTWMPKQFDNAEALGPAGRVHCTMADWAKFIATILPGSETSLLDRSQLDRLTDPTGDYAAGWGTVRRSWAEGKALHHNGSNTMWFATVWVAPNLNRAYMVATNSSDEHSNAVCDKVIQKLIALDRTPIGPE